MSLTKFPRVRLASLPTPIHKLPRLTEYLGGPPIYVKRDDLTGLAFGGNKTRKLEYIVADAQQQGASHLITTGADQSNHARQTAAAARAVGMKAILVLRAESESPELQGNYLLDTMLDAECRFIVGEADMHDQMELAADEVRQTGGTPYIVEVGGSMPIGSIGYASAMLELSHQLWVEGLDIRHFYYPTGSGGTQAGIALGSAMFGLSFQHHAVAVSGDEGQKVNLVAPLIESSAELLGITNPTSASALSIDVSQVGEGYGIPTEASLEAIELLAHYEGIFLDPVYTSKAFAALVADIRSGSIPQDEPVMFMHTGGTPALFAMRDRMQSILLG